MFKSRRFTRWSWTVKVGETCLPWPDCCCICLGFPWVTILWILLRISSWPESLEDSFSVSCLKGLSSGAWVLMGKTSQESHHAPKTSVPPLLHAETLQLSSSEHKSQIGKGVGSGWGALTDQHKPLAVVPSFLLLALSVPVPVWGPVASLQFCFLVFAKSLTTHSSAFNFQKFVAFASFAPFFVLVDSWCLFFFF